MFHILYFYRKTQNYRLNDQTAKKNKQMLLHGMHACMHLSNIQNVLCACCNYKIVNCVRAHSLIFMALELERFGQQKRNKTIQKNAATTNQLSITNVSEKKLK